MMVPEEMSLLVSSDPSQGATNVSADGSSFEIQLEEPIEIPVDAVNITTSVEEATVWWTVPNVIESKNDTFYVFGDRADGGPAQLFTVKIETGLYDLTGLNNSLQSGLEKVGAKVLDGTAPKPLIQLAPDDATQKVLIRFNYTNVYVDFQPTDSLREILGFNATQVGPFSTAPLNELAPNVASFNTVNYFLIASDLVQRGIRFNNRFNQIVSQVLINVSPGSQIISTPFNPAKVPSNELAGSKRTVLRFRLTDDKLRPVNTNKEYFTARVVIRYMRPFIVERSRK
tara:strand:+ start:6994 stop:7848 length:855 start_codon:yes stop_codon:yes gene_type:complete